MARPALARDSVDTATQRCGPRRHWLRAAVLIAVALLAVALPVAATAAATDATGPEDVDARIRALVADLGYDADVGDRCCRFVSDWKLPAWKRRIDEARRLARESHEAYTRAVDLAPRHVEALANRACVAIDLGRPADALADCDRALAIDPRHAIALYNRGVSLAHLGRKAEARAAIERSVEADPASRPRAEQALARFGL